MALLFNSDANLRWNTVWTVKQGRVPIKFCIAVGFSARITTIMMSLFRHLPRLPLLALALCLLVGPGSFANQAWCLDSSGQAGFRVTGGKNPCCSAEEAIQPTAARVSTAFSVQGQGKDVQCLDISAHPHWRSQRSRSITAKPVLIRAPFPIAAACTPPAFNAAPGNSEISFTPRVPESILLHRTIVLLI